MLRKQKQTYNHSGMSNRTYNNIEAGARLNIGGMASVTVNGNIGQNAIIQVSGQGSLRVKGNVGENVKIEAGGMGSITLDNQPPESVEINQSGMGSVHIRSGAAKHTPDTNMKKPSVKSDSNPVNKQKASAFFSSAQTNIHASNNKPVSLKGFKISCTGDETTVTNNGKTTTYQADRVEITRDNRFFVGDVEVPLEQANGEVPLEQPNHESSSDSDSDRYSSESSSSSSDNESSSDEDQSNDAYVTIKQGGKTVQKVTLHPSAFHNKTVCISGNQGVFVSDNNTHFSWTSSPRK